MVLGELQAFMVRQFGCRDTKIKLAVVLPPDRSAGVVTAIGNGLAPSPCHQIWI